MTTYLQVQDDSLVCGLAEQVGIGSGLDDNIDFPYTLPVTADGVQLFNTVVVDPTGGDDMLWGALIAEPIGISHFYLTQWMFNQLVRTVLRLGDALSAGHPVSLSSNISMGLATTIALGWTVLQGFKVTGSPSPSMTFGMALTTAIRTQSALQDFFGLGLSDNAALGLAQSPTYIGSGSLADLVTIEPSLANTMVFNLVSTADIDVTDAELLKMIYAGDPLLDNVCISTLYVAPNGNYTTWAINTRTNAVTEYQNFVFTSFAQMGRKFIAANSTGLFELDGPLDITANIQAQFGGGYFSPGDGKFTAFKAIYLGIRTQDNSKDFFLKLAAGDGRTYTYQFQPNAGDLMNTRINTGKGLRSRFFSWTLVTPGPDFDFENIEFIPLISQRRV